MDVECKHGVDWKGRDWTPESGEKGAHPNARFTTPASQCPVICPDWEAPEGVPIDIFVFGGRRTSVVPLVTESFNWDHGVYLGATAASEATAAALDVKGSIRRDPFAMLPFCGYNMGDYFAHWFKMGGKLGAKAPKIFYVNWFRKNKDGKWLWPGFGDNCRVLEWMCRRVEGSVQAQETPIGLLPFKKDLDLKGLKIAEADVDELLKVDKEAWKNELSDISGFLDKFGARLPEKMREQFKKMGERLG